MEEVFHKNPKLVIEIGKGFLLSMRRYLTRQRDYYIFKFKYLTEDRRFLWNMNPLLV